ncbi:MAG: hypothetical protein LBI68_05365, partial [Azoarcus sp.]|nr:hypothetical protein [Azoarcus sp.]
MKVVHISPTPVAGAPIKIVNALRRYGKIDARFIDLAPNIYGRRTFPEDLCWPMDNNEIYNEIFSANIIHFHQNVSLKEPNLNIDFTNKNQFPKTHFIREWHSEPGLHKRLGKIDIDAFENESFPLLCMAQYHERYYPEAIPVPLLTNVEDLKENIQPLPFPPVVAYSPSTRLPLSEWRWTSKGYDETLTILRELQKNHNFSIDIIEDTPWNEA